MRAKTGWIIGLATAAVVAVGAAGVAATQRKPAGPPPTVVVALGDIEESIVAPASLQPGFVVDVGAEVSGMITKFDVKLGQHVTAGQVLAQIESRQLQNQLRGAQGQAMGDHFNVNQRQTQLSFNEADAKRYKTLVDKGWGGQQKYDQASAGARSAAYELQNAKDQVATDENRIELAKLKLAQATVKAPVSGMVAEILVREGMTINTSDQVPTLLRIARMETMSVRAVVSEADIMRVRPGETVTFNLPDKPNKQFVGTLRGRQEIPEGGALEAERKLSRSGVYYYAVFDVPNPDGGLLPGMTVDVRIVTGRAKAVPVVPASALGAKDRDGRFRVRVLEPGGGVSERLLTVGLRSGSLIEVKDGLKLGERVILPPRNAA